MATAKTKTRTTSSQQAAKAKAKAKAPTASATEPRPTGGKGIVQTDRFFLFWSGWPSQWHPARFAVDGVTYASCEQYMMAEKARVFGDPEIEAKVLATPDPRQQKALGRKVRNFDEAVWTSVCRGVVYAGNLARFAQDADARALLLATGDRTIVEASPRDRIWGVGLAPGDPRAQDPAQWRGRNWLGVALGQVREALARGTPERPAEPTDQELVAQLARRRDLSTAGRRTATTESGRTAKTEKGSNEAHASRQPRP